MFCMLCVVVSTAKLLWANLLTPKSPDRKPKGLFAVLCVPFRSKISQADNATWVCTQMLFEAELQSPVNGQLFLHSFVVYCSVI